VNYTIKQRRRAINWILVI